MADAIAAALAVSSRGAMIAAAGFGKTHTIAKAIADHSCGRELVLTHTHAGIDALRRRLDEFKAPRKTYHVDTIAGWALRLAASFPKSSGVPTTAPRESAEYASVYAGATRLLELRPVREVIRASFSGVYVDEYQDCTIEQHRLVLSLAEVLKCRLVGDPLQGIFGFGDNKAIRWNPDVTSHFEAVAGPTTAWRWKGTNQKLGEWLDEARQKLSCGDAVDLRGAPVRWLAGADPKTKHLEQRKACLAAAKKASETVIAIHHWPAQCHQIASGLNGLFSCIEAIDPEDLYEAASRIDSASGLARCVAVLDFAGKCMTTVKTELNTIRNAFSDDRVPNVKKHVDVRDALCAVGGAEWLKALPGAFEAVIGVSGCAIYRRELWREMGRSLEAVLGGEAATLTDAASIVRNRARMRGRRLPQHAVGTTLLVKGLQFDHAIVLDGDGYDANNLYVALTRGVKSLTVVSKAPTIVPVPAEDDDEQDISDRNLG